MKPLTAKNQKSGLTAPSAIQDFASEFLLIRRLVESGKREEALRTANALYVKHPREAVPNALIALILVENKQLDDALPYAEAAVRLAPENAFNHVFLGKLYLDLGMIEFAPEVLHKAFALDNAMFHAPWALALYYLESGQGSRALPYFDQALEVAPVQFSASIRLDRVKCLTSLGRAAEAEPDLVLAMNVPKHRVDALTQIALLQKNDHTSEFAEQIRNELKKPELTDKDRSDLLLCLGRLHENGRDYDNAFLHFIGSRKLLNSDFEMDRFLLHIEQSERLLTPDVFERFGEFGHESAKPIFVVGMHRSGTTLTEQIIAAHSQAEGVGELGRIARMFRNLSSPGGLQKVLDSMEEVGPERWKDVPQQYLNLLNALAPDAHRTVDKMPQNFYFLGFIHLCFPNAKIIHCKRNPLDNFISAYQNKMSAFDGYSYDQVAYGHYYSRYQRLMQHWKSVLPGKIYDLQYEALTANPEVEIRNMLGFLGLPWENGCLKFNERQATVRTFSQFQVRNPINTGSVERWRNYEKYLSPIIAVFERAGVRI